MHQYIIQARRALIFILFSQETIEAAVLNPTTAL